MIMPVDAFAFPLPGFNYARHPPTHSTRHVPHTLNRTLAHSESATAQRIKEAHRRILMLNHPDTGGSTYLASKINEVRVCVHMLVWAFGSMSIDWVLGLT